MVDATSAQRTSTAAQVLEAPSMVLRAALLVAASGGYLFAFAFLHSVIGGSASVFSMIPVVAGGWLLGLRGGFLAGTFACAANALLISLDPDSDWHGWVVQGGALVSASLVLIGAAVGHLRELSTRANKARAECELLEGALEIARQDRERRGREFDQLARVAAHDLQEPLRKIQALGDRLNGTHGEALGDDGEKYLEPMRGAALRMSNMIDDLARYLRLTTSGEPFRSVSLGEIAQEAVSDLQGSLEELEGRVEVGVLPTIEADPPQMRQMIRDLVDNGLKFHRENEAPVVKVTGQLLDAETHGGGSVAGARQFCRIVVEDNGIGFDEKHSDRIFMLFQRLHDRNEYEGTGVGLAVCRKIAELHGGDLTAVSTLGTGSTFTVTLPAGRTEKELRQ